MAVDRGNEQLKWVINSLFRRIRPHAHYAFTVYLLRLFLVESVALPVPYLYPYPYLPICSNGYSNFDCLDCINGWQSLHKV